MRHVSGGDVGCRGFTVALLVVKEDVRAEGGQERPLVTAAQEQRLIDAHAPLAQSQDHPLVRWRRACGHQRGANRRLLCRQRALNPVQGVENGLEGPT